MVISLITSWGHWPRFGSKIPDEFSDCASRGFKLPWPWTWDHHTTVWGTADLDAGECLVDLW